MQPHLKIQFIKTVCEKKKSVLSAELNAIDSTLDIISERNLHQFIIISDSLSALLSIKNKKQENTLVVKILTKSLHYLQKQ